jgi:putative transposase
MTDRRYPSDLSDAEWARLQPLLPAPKPGGRPRTTDLRAVCNAIFYQAHTGCQWRYLPREFPAPGTVYDYFRTWRTDGTWDALNAALRAATRTAAGRDPTPSAAILDSQSVPMAQQPGERGYDGHKRVKGRKRHILVDTLGLLLAVAVLSATSSDRVGAQHTFLRLGWRVPRLRLIWADGSYGGRFAEWVARAYSWVLEVIPNPARTPGQRGMPVAKRRWVVERTFAWFGTARRLSKDYETHPASQEAWCYIVMIRLMLRRLERAG